ncbi:MAG: iron-sulfur cluster repair di-iron protein [Acidimicrobiales bacterium]|jgi:regulator of cell morphogenesis and NO signaling|nr:iron-sulfur cluster repair di-iron protein [Acidimicrobiales bacterium]
MSIDTDRPVADLVTDDPRRARLLNDLGIDFCCGGQRSLAAWSEEIGRPVEDVVAALAEADRTALADSAVATARPAWADANVPELIEHILDVHHTYLWERMPAIRELADKVASVHGDHHPELIEIRRITTALLDELDGHLRKEEQILFPLTLQLTEAEAAGDRAPAFHCGRIANPIRVMLLEHDHAGEALAELRRLSNGYTVPEDGCASYRLLYEELEQLEGDLHLHVHKENNVLFPQVLELENRLAS